MEPTDIKKALANIKKHAVEPPVRTRKGILFVIPDDLITEIETQIADHDGAFAIPVGKFNGIFGWTPTSVRSSYLKTKLNADNPREDGKEWNVSSRNDGEFYIFSIDDIKTEEPEPNTQEQE